MTTPSPNDLPEDRPGNEAEDSAEEWADDGLMAAASLGLSQTFSRASMAANVGFNETLWRASAVANLGLGDLSTPVSLGARLGLGDLSTPMGLGARLGLGDLSTPMGLGARLGLGEVTSLATLSRPISFRMDGLLGQVMPTNRPAYASFTAFAASQVAARNHMAKFLDQSLPNAALGVSIAQAARPSMRLLEAYDGWLSSYRPKTWTAESFGPVASRGFTVDGLIATESLSTLAPDAVAHADLTDLVEAEVLPPWKEARLDLNVQFEARLAAIDPKMAEFYRAACAALRREGQDGFLEEACTGLYELLVRLVRQHVATDEKMKEYELANPGEKLRNAQGKYTYAARIRFATLSHRKGSDRDLFAATAAGLAKAHDALVSKASKGRHESVGNAMTLRTLLMATESTLSQILDLYETQSNPLQD
ncbi:hypothetical protein ACIO3S_17990 [Nocardioides sp. NPDC087217]|uniref:hypothetical protein n=1 Tax=Nocardioides sp. NPDC087217 TaxID=3364335 RepID=UPI00380BBC57